ncbi:MAG: RNA polymerase sigma factor [Planctomycetota bacterium]|jgi:RNA polymerase sigma-70 factor (ECF subfamily)
MLTRTTTALLDDLIDPANEAVWEEFDARYRPVLVAFARRIGLAPEDAADAAQEALARFVKSYREGRYDRTRGRLHSWLFGIARHCVLDIREARAARREGRGLSAVADLPEEGALSRLWDDACDREILQKAVDLLPERTKTDPQTIRAFELLAFEQRPPADVAETLGVSLNDVYLAKHRCLRRLRSIVAELSAAYEVER